MSFVVNPLIEEARPRRGTPVPGRWSRRACPLPMTMGMWAWIGAGLLGWLVVATLVGVVVGRGIRLADRRDAVLAPRNFVVDPSVIPAAPR